MKKTLVSIFIYLFITSCGFKNLNLADNFKIENLKINNAGRETFILKNELINYSSEQASNSINLDVEIKSIEEVKDKDITNTVKRYNLTVEIQLKLENLKTKEIFSQKFSKTSEYEAANNYSDTLQNLKKVKEDSILKLAEDIINYISNQLN